MPKVLHSKVCPDEVLPEQRVKLSIGDVYAPKVWVTQALFWPVECATSFERCHELLRTGLSRTLHDVPALAGRVIRLSDDPRDLAIDVTRDAHVEFTAEDLSTCKDIPSYAALKAAGFSTMGLAAAFSPPAALRPVCEGCPILTAKLSFLDGGAVLLIGTNHIFADGAAIGKIQNIWAGHTAAAATDRRYVAHEQDPGDEETRRRLSTTVPGVNPRTGFKDWKIVPAQHSALYLAGAPGTSRPSEEANADTQQNSDCVEAPGQLEWSVWYLSQEALVGLKSVASEGLQSNAWISTVDALISLFWSRIALTKQPLATTPPSQESVLYFAINIRPRLQPPISPHFLGNAVDMMTKTLTLQELSREDSIQVAARAVRAAIGDWKESEWAARLTVCAGLPATEALCPDTTSLLSKGNIGITDASKLQTHLSGWGPELGRVERMRYTMPVRGLPSDVTIVSIHPRLQDGAIEVTVSLSAFTQQALLADTIFSSYASLVCAYT
ncbi:trichothecene 3-o-acetyltransferase like protein [Zymoseptoria brevis]|uniref:Trichothecene 3-o-acetyltransferase like protein n=1 Tax=Zymoseptoria brevis TaxID=1047168 RepID=A0A0F4G7M1_9PEZI|nr:trichothecene 3-o-acetyltransferase like protein [Zymoseptoria brevis]